jgi:hypothetical protein
MAPPNPNSAIDQYIDQSGSFQSSPSPVYDTSAIAVGRDVKRGAGIFKAQGADHGLTLTGWAKGKTLFSRRVSGLKRIGQLLRAVEDGDHVEAIGHDAVDQPIRVNDQLAQILVIKLWHDASGARVMDSLRGPARELIDHALGAERRIAMTYW